MKQFFFFFFFVKIKFACDNYDESRWDKSTRQCATIA